MVINKFRGNHFFLSNFYPHKIYWEDIWFPSSEHAYQAAKTLDKEERKRIALSPTPADAKRMGKKIMGKKIKLRDNWEKIKYDIMMEILLIKFNNPELKNSLAKTAGQLLEEGNWWHDNYWGNCYCEKCENIIGQNLLGKLLIKIRNML
jgi:ribA/ribD-fused uncharacterized protein